MNVLLGFWFLALGIIEFCAVFTMYEWYEKICLVIVTEAIVMALSGGVYLMAM